MRDRSKLKMPLAVKSLCLKKTERREKRRRALVLAPSRTERNHRSQTARTRQLWLRTAWYCAGARMPLTPTKSHTCVHRLTAATPATTPGSQGQSPAPARRRQPRPRRTSDGLRDAHCPGSSRCRDKRLKRTPSPPPGRSREQAAITQSRYLAPPPCPPA